MSLISEGDGALDLTFLGVAYGPKLLLLASWDGSTFLKFSLLYFFLQLEPRHSYLSLETDMKPHSVKYLLKLIDIPGEKLGMVLPAKDLGITAFGSA